MLLEKIEKLYAKYIDYFYKIDSRAFVFFALLFLIFVPVAILFKRDDIAERLAVYTYYSLLMYILAEGMVYLLGTKFGKYILTKIKLIKPYLETVKNIINKTTKNINSKNKSGVQTEGLEIDKKTTPVSQYAIDNASSDQDINLNNSSKTNTGKTKVNFLIISYITGLVVFPWWINRGSLFFVDFTWGQILDVDYSFAMTPIYKIFYYLGLVIGHDIVQKLFLTSIIFGVLWAGYRMAGLATALLAVLNPFVYDRFMYGQINLVLGYMFLLLMVSIFIDNYVNNKLKFTSLKALKYGVLYGLAIICSPHYIFIGGVLFLAILFFYRKNNKVAFLYFLVPLILINSIWLYNNFFNSGQILNYVTKGITSLDYKIFETRGDNFFERFWYTLNLMGFWASATGRYFDIASRVLYFWPFLFVFASAIYGAYLFTRDKSKYVLIGSVSFFVLILILSQATSFLFLTNTIYKIPFYNGLREPQKWVALLAVLYIFFISFAIKKLDTEKSKYLQYIIGIASIIWVPYMFLGLWGQVKPIQYPAYFAELDKNLLENACYVDETTLYSKNGSNILILPWHMYTSFKWTYGKVIAHPAKQYFYCKVTTGTNMEWGNIYDNSEDPIGSQISRWVYFKGKEPLPNSINIIILIKDADYENYNFITGFEKLKETEDYIMYKRIKVETEASKKLKEDQKFYDDQLKNGAVNTVEAG